MYDNRLHKHDYEIKEISYKDAMKIVLEKHYLHRKCQASFKFGLFKRDNDRLLGIITYGTPASPTACSGVCGPDERNNVIELTRLWIHDSVPKNGESYLIAHTLKLIPKNIIISYAEVAQGHLGIVYQSTNWFYVGLTLKRTNRVKIDGTETKHNRSQCYDKENTVLVDRPRKHRYVYFLGSKKRKKELLKKLRYSILSYPKEIP